MSAFRFRPFRNSDPPALVELWNRGLPSRNVVQPLVVHEFDTLVMGRLLFDREGLIVAERAETGRIVGFAHAGFGPLQPRGPSHAPDLALGTIAMMAIEPGLDDPELDLGLVREAERYLRGRGAQVCYAGGRYPLDPFYWGIYGGSEFSGILGDHKSFHRAVGRAGYRPVSRVILLEFDLEAREEPRDPKLALLRRQTRLEVVEDTPPLGWWAALAIGPFRPMLYRTIHKADQSTIAAALTWEIASGFGGDRNRTALVGFEVAAPYRRRGFGRLLLADILRQSRNLLAEIVAVQTLDTNAAALGLYEGAGFERVETATLYRAPDDPSVPRREVASAAERTEVSLSADTLEFVRPV